MKKITPVLAILFFVLPSISSAAALTQQQSTSLIAVVQSSPGTPASAFVSLITAFSNITTAQASSLITVVQAAPSAPANVFVDLLTSFTDDTSVTQTPATPDPTLGAQITTLNQQLEDLKQQNAETQAKLGQIVQNTTPSPAEETPAPPPVEKKLEVSREGNSSGISIIYSENGKTLADIPVDVSASYGYFLIPGQWGRDVDAGKKVTSYTFVTKENGIRSGVNGIMLGHNADGVNPIVLKPRPEVGYPNGLSYYEQRDDGAYYPGAIITVTVKGITKTIQMGTVYRLSPP